MKDHHIRVAPLAVAIALACSPLAQAACPDTIVVNSKADTVADDGKRTLREAIELVPLNGETCTSIRFNLADGARIALAGTIYITDRNVSIEGPGAGKLTITTAPDFTSDEMLYIFHETSATTTSVSGITFDGDADRDGTADARTDVVLRTVGGNNVFRGVVVKNVAVSNSGAALTVERPASLQIIGSRFLDNSNNGNGGAVTIYNEAAGSSVQVRNSYFSGNQSGASGGALYVTSEGTPGPLVVRGSTFSGNVAVNGGGLAVSAGTAQVSNSTFSANAATTRGGALYAEFATVSVNYSTVAYNSAGDTDGALSSNAATFSGTHDIVSLNTADGAASNTLGGAVLTNSLVDKPGGKLDLTALRDNGGSTPTHMPKAGSIAIDAGRTKLGTAPATDQRGKPRLQGAAIDIGAVEAQ